MLYISQAIDNNNYGQANYYTEGSGLAGQLSKNIDEIINFYYYDARACLIQQFVSNLPT